MTKTNAIRQLESLAISFAVREYSYSADTMDAVSVAETLGVEPERVFKTLVTTAEDGAPYVFCLPGSSELDLKKAASAASAKRVQMLKAKELQPLTGYIRGGCSPIGMKRPLPTVIDETAVLFERILVSAGIRGLQIEIAPADLLSITEGRLADLTA